MEHGIEHLAYGGSRSSGWHENCETFFWLVKRKANSLAGCDIEILEVRGKQIGKATTMNRWMKRRIERSRARCEQTESQKRERSGVSRKGRASKHNRAKTKETDLGSDAHSQTS